MAKIRKVKKAKQKKFRQLGLSKKAARTAAGKATKKGRKTS